MKKRDDDFTTESTEDTEKERYLPSSSVLSVVKKSPSLLILPAKRILHILFLILILIAVARFCHFKTGGFRISKIQNNLSDLTYVEPVPDPAILNQKYHYLNRGFQSFVFVSDDGKYVLKLFNNYYKKRMKQTKWEATCNSYLIATTKLKEETGLIYLHVSPTEQFKEPLIITDRLGIEHPINLDKTGFLIQKKADLVYPRITSLMATGKVEEAKYAIRSLLQLIADRCRAGIADNDPLVRTNYGFLGSRPIQIDVGAFYCPPEPDQPEIAQAEIKKISANLSHWLETHYPELCENF